VTNMRDAEPGDIYVDDDGKLWRVVGVICEPSVTVEAVEHEFIIGGAPQFPRRSGGITGHMWHDYQRIYRPSARSAASEIDSEEASTP